jgi:hypothetical protein
MALRLARWLVQTKSKKVTRPKSLEEAAQYHVTEGCFLDWARLSLQDPIHDLSNVYKRLFEQITEIREQQSHEFATLLQDWTALGSSRPSPIPVENILDAIVVPLAAKNRVLLIVMDGMSLAVCRELLTDIRRQDWTLLTQEDQPSSILAGLATIPSVTEASRMSLLSGQLQCGVMKDEKKGFSSHSGLLKHCRKNAHPLLFHKASLQGEEDAVLSNEVREAIQSPQNQVIGVVVNAIDDQLSKGDQLDVYWSCDRIKVLPALLHEARNSDRLVIVTSDHGHVLEHETSYQSYEGGERWRLDDAPPTANELKISGPRVVMPDSKTLIAPWTEKLRYKPKKNGYHGGLTPQEMVVPIAVLSPSSSFPKGWTEAAIDTPDWWEEPIKVAEASNFYSVTPQVQTNEYMSFGPLFDVLEEAPEETTSSQSMPDWVKALLASPAFEQQKQLVGRSVPSDEVFAQILVTLNNREGGVSLTAMARLLNQSFTQTLDLIAVIQRVLNVDGYIVLDFNETSSTIELNRNLLYHQFSL